MTSLASVSKCNQGNDLKAHFKIKASTFNPLMPGGNKKVTHT